MEDRPHRTVEPLFRDECQRIPFSNLVFSTETAKMSSSVQKKPESTTIMKSSVAFDGGKAVVEGGVAWA